MGQFFDFCVQPFLMMLKMIREVLVLLIIISYKANGLSKTGNKTMARY